MAKPSLLPNLAVRRRGGSMALPATARPERVLLKISDSSDLGGTCPSPDGPKLCGASLGFVCRLGQALLSQSLPTSTTPWDGSNSGASPAPARRPGAASTRREYFRRLRFSPDGKYALGGLAPRPMGRNYAEPRLDLCAGLARRCFRNPFQRAQPRGTGLRKQ